MVHGWMGSGRGVLCGRGLPPVNVGVSDPLTNFMDGVSMIIPEPP